MCGSMVDIQPPTAENRKKRKKKKEEEKRKKPQLGGHNNKFLFTCISLKWNIVERHRPTVVKRISNKTSFFNNYEFTNVIAHKHRCDKFSKMLKTRTILCRKLKAACDLPHRTSPLLVKSWTRVYISSYLYLLTNLLTYLLTYLCGMYATLLRAVRHLRP